MNKAIMIADKPIWCGKIMNRDKTIEVRKNKALYKATMQLIKEQGYATFFMYCTKDKHKRLIYTGERGFYPPDLANGKVVAKFTVRKVEEITYDCKYYNKNIWGQSVLLEKSCLKLNELDNYLKASSFYRETNIGEVVGYAYHIEDLVIFDKPKELWEFGRKYYPQYAGFVKNKTHYALEPITKAPQNFCYVESEE